MSDSFSQTLRLRAAPIWDAIFAHPFLQALADGSLPEASFRFYLCQDYAFLDGFARAVALLLAKAPDSATLRLLAQRIPVPVERELHRQLFSLLGIAERDAEQLELAPTTRAYVDHLLATAALGTLGEAAAALLPCPWTYHELGQRLATVHHPIYRQWAAIYQQGFLRESVAAWRTLVDAAATEAGPAQRARMERAFLLSSRYEYAFWDMAHRHQQWPV